MNKEIKCKALIDELETETVVKLDSDEIINWTIGSHSFSGLSYENLEELREDFPFCENEVFKLLTSDGIRYTLVAEDFDETVFGRGIEDTGIRIPTESLKQIIKEMKEFSKEMRYYS